MARRWQRAGRTSRELADDWEIRAARLASQRAEATAGTTRIKPRRCQALLYQKHGIKDPHCTDVAHGAPISGVDLCWLHRRIVEQGLATTEQILEGKRR